MVNSMMGREFKIVENIGKPVTSHFAASTQFSPKRENRWLLHNKIECKVEIWYLGYLHHGEFNGGVGISKFRPTCDVTWSIKA